jgi:NADH-quinone oxidoreductase subunit L
MVWLVFYGEPRGEGHVHDAGPAMKISTGLLALGTLTSWLLIGGFGELLEEYLPFHHLHIEATDTLLEEVITAEATFVALGVVALGLLGWWFRKQFTWVGDSFDWLGRAASADFGFEWLNRQIVTWTQNAANALRTTQTGYLSWNVVGIIGGLLVVLIILALGA